jgi:hypothetical protein
MVCVVLLAVVWVCVDCRQCVMGGQPLAHVFVFYLPDVPLASSPVLVICINQHVSEVWRFNTVQQCMPQVEPAVKECLVARCMHCCADYFDTIFAAISIDDQQVAKP